MLELFILLRSSGVGPVDFSGRALVIGIIFIILTARSPEKDPTAFAKYSAFLYVIMGALWIYEEGYGKMALLGMAVTLFYSLGMRWVPEKKNPKN